MIDSKIKFQAQIILPQIIIKTTEMQRKETQIISGTDMNAVGQVEQQYYDVLKILIDPELQGLKSRIQMLYTNLTEHLETESNHIRKCKMMKSDIDSFVSRIASCNKTIQEQAQHADNIKKDLEKLEHETSELKRKESDVKDLIVRHKLQMNIIEKDSIKGLQEIEIKQENDENQLKKRLDEQVKVKEQLQTKQVSLMTQQKFGMEEYSDLQKVMSDINSQIDDLRQKIKEIEAQDSRQKRNNDQKKEELNKAKLDKDFLKEQKVTLETRIKDLEKELEMTAEHLRSEKKSKDQQQRAKLKLQKELEQFKKDHTRKQEEIQKMKGTYVERQEQLEKYQDQHRIILSQKNLVEKELQMAAHKISQIKTENEDVSRKKAQKLAQKQIEASALQKLSKEKQKIKGKINQLISSKIEEDKKYKANQNKEHDLSQQNVEELNKLKKISNEVASYQVEQEKLAKVLEQIKKEQEKYGIEASHAHSKYYQTLEELKIKNTQIQNLQRENQEIQSKCKYQQNLYDAVRSDRNLYCKDFMKSKEEINQLWKKYKRMTYSVEQNRDDIKNKDQELVELDKQFKKVEKENEKIRADKNRVKSQIKSTQQVIKNQENHVGHLKKIIQQAKNQKAKQQKDYDMVRNERDILGTQLIKRNQELAVLYQKIKLSNSNLTKGEIYFKEKQKELNEFKVGLATQRNEFLSIDQQIRCIDELKAEIAFKEKQLLNQRAKIKALEEQLKNPMNVHRWRKLEATDQENYERILKIQTLQRRLIAKTEEVEAKQNLIREKEKLFLELKNILARQPGVEIHQQLVKYRQALKEKSGQMKKMKRELQEAHEDMGRVRFEVDRQKSDMHKMKKEYFELRETSEKEVMNERNFADEIMNMGDQGDDIKGMEVSAMKI